MGSNGRAPKKKKSCHHIKRNPLKNKINDIKKRRYFPGPAKSHLNLRLK